MRADPRRIRLLGNTLVAVFFVTSGVSAEIRLSPTAVVLEPGDVLAKHTTRVDGVDWVAVGGDEAWALAPSDPPHDTTYSPADPLAVADAWRDIHGAFRERVPLTVVCLPRPRSSLPNSSAEDNVIYMSPGVTPYDPAQVSFLLAHEMGHCVHRELLRDEDIAGWREYRRVRGIEDESRYHDWAPHPDRPREIFAEDFRYLFGGHRANYSGTIENSNLPLPDEVAGLQAFFLELVGESAEAPITAGYDVAALPEPLPGYAAFVIDAREIAMTRALLVVDAAPPARLTALRRAQSSRYPGVESARSSRPPICRPVLRDR